MDDVGGEKGNEDLYAVLGLNKECSESELRNAYRKLALKWHPDRCSSSRNSKFVEEAKKKFQAIQQAYSVLSDANKRFLYDVGLYDSDNEENGMDEFLMEMAAMMSQTKPNGEESLEELQQLLEEMFEDDDVVSSAASSFHASSAGCSASSSTFLAYTATSTASTYHNFCSGTDGEASRYEGKGRRRSQQ